MSEAVRYRVRHETTYRYGGDVVHSRQLLHLTPRAAPWQSCLAHAIDLEPMPASRRDEADAFGNTVTRLEFDRPHDRLEVIARMEVEVRPRPEFDAGATESWERVRDDLTYTSRPLAPRKLDAVRYRMQSPYVRVKHAFQRYALECFPEERPILAGAEALMRKLHADLTYAPGETNIATPLMKVFESRRGVCQDYAHLMIACLRSFGLPARYVSGYLRTIPAKGETSLVGADASHAWLAVYCPPLGWVELDPTNGIRVGIDHVALAWGRDFGDVSPLRGVIVGGGRHEPSVKVTVEPAVADS
jgi:transglutaminase-like putative cysteine protease